MGRNSITDALVLSVKPQGENNRSICLLTKDKGIVYAVLYGGPKSKLRSEASPWSKGVIYLYTDETRHSVKITDFDVKNYHPSFRESLFKSWAASLAAEIVLKTKCAGSVNECWILLNGFLDGLEILGEKEGRLGLIRFLWRYLSLLGVCPDTGECVRCQNHFFTGKFECNNVKLNGKNAYYSYVDNGFICENCANVSGSINENCTKVLTESVSYLEITSNYAPNVSRNINLSEDAVNNLKQFVFFMAENAVGTKLNTLVSGLGIL